MTSLLVVNMPNISLLVISFCALALISHVADATEVTKFRRELDDLTKTTACNGSNALCSNITCTYCRCMSQQTYLQTKERYGECVSNDLVIYNTCTRSSCSKSHIARVLNFRTSVIYEPGDHLSNLACCFEGEEAYSLIAGRIEYR